MRRPIARARWLGTAVVMSIVLVACGTQTQTQTSGPSASGPAETPNNATGGTVRIGIGGSPDSLNPGNGLLSESYTLYELVYDTPIAVNVDGEFVPELASDWSVSDDGKTWTLTIVENATFHDGTPLTAEDIAFSMQLYKDTEDFPYLPSYASYFDTIEAPDATHVVLTTADPISNFEAQMVFMYVLPKHIWQDVEDPIAFENAEMIGSGPFKLVENVQDEHTTLAANKDYWNGAPNIDEVIFQTISNADARVTALTTGQVDAISEFPATAVPALQNSENVNVHIADVAAGGDLRDIIFDMVDPANCPTDDGGECTGHPALLDRSVRQALAMATDKQQIIDVATLGTASQGVGLVPPGLGDYFIGTDADYAFNGDAANQMLEDAGYSDTNGDGVRECKSGQDCPTGDLTFRFNYPDDIDTGATEAGLIKDMWAAVGVKLEVQALDADTLTSLCCPTFDYDVILWGWGSDPDPDFLSSVLTCKEIPTGYSESGYCNPAYDDLYHQQALELDRDARIDSIRQMQQMVLDDVPYIIPYYSQTREAWRTDTFSGWLNDDPTLSLVAQESLSVLRPLQ